jgi:hypothetical protein
MPLVLDGGDDRVVIVAPAGDRDVGGLAGRRIAALGADQQGRGRQPAVGERHPNARRIPNDLGGRCRHQQAHLLRGRGGFLKRGSQPPVLDHDPERVVLVPGIEGDSAGREAVADPDRADRAALALQPLGDPDRFQHPPRGAGDGGGPAVEGGREHLLRLGRVDDEAREAVPVEGDGEGEADEAAAEDDDVRSLHGASNDFLPLPMQGCNAKRLTGDSRRAH